MKRSDISSKNTSFLTLLKFSITMDSILSGIASTTPDITHPPEECPHNTTTDSSSHLITLTTSVMCVSRLIDAFIK